MIGATLFIIITIVLVLFFYEVSNIITYYLFEINDCNSNIIYFKQNK